MPAVDTGKVSLFFTHTDADHESQPEWAPAAAPTPNAAHFHASGEPPVVLLHELGGSSASWASVVPLLSATRQVLAVDLRGAGRSEKPPGAVEISDLADDVTDLLAALGHRHADLVGAALGSLVGALVALRHPERVRHLAMCAVAPDMSGATEQYFRQRSERVRMAGMRAVADASLANAFPAAHAKASAAYRAIYLANDPNAYAEMSLALARLRLRTEDWSAIRAPTLVTSGAHDFIWPPESGRRVASLVPGARFMELPDAGHFPHLQTPHALAGAVTTFLCMS